MSLIQLDYAFLLFLSVFLEIHWKLLLLVKKVNLSERSSEILGKFIFLNKFEKHQIEKKLD